MEVRAYDLSHHTPQKAIRGDSKAHELILPIARYSWSNTFSQRASVTLQIFVLKSSLGLHSVVNLKKMSACLQLHSSGPVYSFGIYLRAIVSQEGVFFRMDIILIGARIGIKARIVAITYQKYFENADILR